MGRYPMVLGLIAATFLYFLGHQSLPAVWSYYASEKFDWSPRDIGVSLAVIGVGQIIVSAGLIRVVIGWSSPRTTAYLGYGFAIAAYLGYAYADNGIEAYAALALGAFAGFTSAVAGILSNRVPANAQGELQGALASVNSVGSIIGPLLMTQLFAYFAGSNAPVYLPGAPFLVSAVLTVVAWAVFLRAANTPDTGPPRRSRIAKPCHFVAPHDAASQPLFRMSIDRYASRGTSFAASVTQLGRTEFARAR